MCLTSCKSYLCQMILLKAMLKFEILSMLFLSMFLLRNLLLFPLHYETCIDTPYFLFFVILTPSPPLRLDLGMGFILFAYVLYSAYLLEFTHGFSSSIHLIPFQLYSPDSTHQYPNLLDNAALSLDLLDCKMITFTPDKHWT